ncbi:hypothetical protein HAN_1g62 (nucleomorph) [Hemiselmis andersenii]|uniref:Uncharacterized protein n=1 Tax=Hemiselmis andersenii TaxID=464988 RepID=A9BK74_HEMAN|nr:hypothetical protein HAN_1g62 [Hemiselmis andersenii]ABW97907.1 hypothetical protein HAN_1g62 [Hemiselmis andersenii]|mmetsp:Transcript_37479/g.91087  ORF Transcript_37479/g.91087 Transcript_37479/m.91087 type:complete len:121 (+) Transcript_37479:464-826(+)
MENSKKKNNYDNVCLKKGILLIKNLNYQVNFFLLRKIFERFGKINKLFFVHTFSKQKKSNFQKNTIILGWIEYFDKIEAKKASICLNLFKNFPFNKSQKLVVKYQKSLSWKNLIKILGKT